MSRGPADPLTRQALSRAEAHQDTRRRHRADGRVSPEEEAVEEEEVFDIVRFMAGVDEAFSIGQSIQRYGPECGHARRLLGFRARRRADGLTAA